MGMPSAAEVWPRLRVSDTNRNPPINSTPTANAATQSSLMTPSTIRGPPLSRFGNRSIAKWRRRPAAYPAPMMPIQIRR